MSKQKKTQEIVVSKDETQVFFVEFFIGAEQNEKVTINSQCGIDICLDYAKKSFIKAIHTRLALHDTGGNPNEEEQFKLKLLLLDINSLSPSNIALKDSSGNEIRFKEVSLM